MTGKFSSQFPVIVREAGDAYKERGKSVQVHQNVVQIANKFPRLFTEKLKILRSYSAISWVKELKVHHENSLLSF